MNLLPRHSLEIVCFVVICSWQIISYFLSPSCVLVAHECLGHSLHIGFFERERFWYFLWSMQLTIKHQKAIPCKLILCQNQKDFWILFHQNIFFKYSLLRRTTAVKGLKHGTIHLSHTWRVSLISSTRRNILLCWFMSQCSVHWNKGPSEDYGYRVVVNQLYSFESHSKRLCQYCRLFNHLLLSRRSGTQSSKHSWFAPVMPCSDYKKNLLSSFSYRYLLNSQRYL